MIRFIKILMTIPVLYLIGIPFWFAYYHDSKPCGEIDIRISDSAEYHFVTRQHLMNLTYGSKHKLLGTSVRNIPVVDIENRIKDLKELKVAEVFMTVDGTLNIHVDQRNPVMRIIPDEGGDYFVDEEGFVFRKRNLYSPRLHIIGGNINITPLMLENVSILDTSFTNNVLRDVFHLVTYLRNDSFWSAQIDQIYIDSRKEIDLFPRVGNHLIHLGSAENYSGKLKNLEALYEKVLPEAGWNKYSMINLEFRDQIVCRRRQ
ncbi:MAG: cell division protein FtsQ/DivIB [Bacteroidales bacterium]|nr:cell division protein FtsQ/DivIB [Bacteroidales bacterium]